MTSFRTESDTMGEIEVPADALYAAQTQRAVNSFKISGTPMPPDFISALIRVKSAAALANGQLNALPPAVADAIHRSCESLLASPDYPRHFPVDIFQTGSGTSTNMNANEVIASLASRSLGEPISANDQVNCGQSSNDVIPTTIHLSVSLKLQQQLLPALAHLSDVIRSKATEVAGYCKTGRTHLMDAMPVTMDQPLSGWAAQIDQNIERLHQLQPSLLQLAQGGTAVGTGVNTHPDFAATFCEKLRAATGLAFQPTANNFAALSSQDTVVAFSGELKVLAVSLTKISNDLRWMNSGPLSGLGEIELEALQPGSSIMPGKVNPVIPEAVAMAAAQVIGNDTTITLAGQSGNFELNVMLPLIASRILESIELMANSADALADKAIRTFRVRPENLRKALDSNPILATALNPYIGYNKAAVIAKMAYAEGKPVLQVALRETDLDEKTLRDLLDPKNLTKSRQRS